MLTRHPRQAWPIQQGEPAAIRTCQACHSRARRPVPAPAIVGSLFSSKTSSLQILCYTQPARPQLSASLRLCCHRLSGGGGGFAWPASVPEAAPPVVHARGPSMRRLWRGRRRDASSR